MPHFTLDNSPQGPILNAVATVSSARRVALEAAGLSIPDPVNIRALIDTGASLTCLDSSVALALQLNPTGSTRINTPSTGVDPAPADQYDISLYIPTAIQGQHGLFLPALPVICVDGFLSSQNIHGLIGRDILSLCIFYYNGTIGQFSLAF